MILIEHLKTCGLNEEQCTAVQNVLLQAESVAMVCQRALEGIVAAALVGEDVTRDLQMLSPTARDLRQFLNQSANTLERNEQQKEQAIYLH